MLSEIVSEIISEVMSETNLGDISKTTSEICLERISKLFSEMLIIKTKKVKLTLQGGTQRVRSAIEPQCLGSSHPCYILCPLPPKKIRSTQVESQ